MADDCRFLFVAVRYAEDRMQSYWKKKTRGVTWQELFNVPYFHISLEGALANQETNQIRANSTSSITNY